MNRSNSRNHRNTVRSAGRRRGRPRWVDWPLDRLLDLRLCDLDVHIEGSWLQERIDRIEEELNDRGLGETFQPHYWLSSEWFTPDGVPGVAIPFYLAHPRLVRLEERQMLEAEGATIAWCMRLLRHEVGHAISNAYRLHRRKRWREVFGSATAPYPRYYNPKPYSKSYVLHLDHWYAQSHPAEDFAETFAVWLTPRYPWRKRYAGWRAMKKLEYVDELMGEIAGSRPPVRNKRQVEPLSSLRMTLREHYLSKRQRYGMEYPSFYDRDLRRLFREPRECPGGEPASRFLRRVSPQIRRLVAHWTGQYQYTIDQVLTEMISRCRELKLRVDKPQQETALEAAILLTVQTMNYLHGGHHRVAI